MSRFVIDTLIWHRHKPIDSITFHAYRFALNFVISLQRKIPKDILHNFLHISKLSHLYYFVVHTDIAYMQTIYILHHLYSS
jgi:hypothetical protein